MRIKMRREQKQQMQGITWRRKAKMKVIGKMIEGTERVKIREST